MCQLLEVARARNNPGHSKITSRDITTHDPAGNNVFILSIRNGPQRAKSVPLLPLPKMLLLLLLASAQVRAPSFSVFTSGTAAQPASSREMWVFHGHCTFPSDLQLDEWQTHWLWRVEEVTVSHVGLLQFEQG